MTVQSMIQVCLMVILIWQNRTLRAHVPGLGRREEGLAKTKDGLLAPATGDGLLQPVPAPPVSARSVVKTNTDQG